MASWNDFVNWAKKAEQLVSSVNNIFGGGPRIPRGTNPRPLPGPLPVSNFDPYAPPGISGPYNVHTPTPDSPYIPDVVEKFFYENGNGYGSFAPSDLQECNFANVIMQPRYEQRMKCNKGYVAVRCAGPDGNVVEMCMFKPVAKALKLWKPRAKPAVSAKDMRILNSAGRTARKLTSIAKKAGALPKARRRRTSG